MPATRTHRIVRSALMAALIAASAQFTIPVGQVPVTLQVLMVALAALILSHVEALAATATYVLAGAFGMPVFAGGKAGMDVLAGPTGGYLIGFILGATLGAGARRVLDRASALLADAIAVTTVLAVVYILGWAQLVVVTTLGPSEAFLAGVLPFIALDGAKAIAAVGLAGALRRAGLPVVGSPASRAS